MNHRSSSPTSRDGIIHHPNQAGAQKDDILERRATAATALWLTETFNVEAYPLRELGLRDAEKLQIYQAAKQADATADFQR